MFENQPYCEFERLFVTVNGKLWFLLTKMSRLLVSLMFLQKKKKITRYFVTRFQPRDGGPPTFISGPQIHESNEQEAHINGLKYMQLPIKSQTYETYL